MGRAAPETRPGGAGDGALTAALWQALAEVPDPEIPVVSVVDLGMVEAIEADAATGAVRVTLLPTFVGCPALGLIRQGVARRLEAVPGVRQVEVRVTYSPPWSTDRITPEGRRKLASFGIAPPPARGPAEGRAAGVGATGTLPPQGVLENPPAVEPAGDGGGTPAAGCRAAQRLATLIPFPGAGGGPAGPGSGPASNLPGPDTGAPDGDPIPCPFCGSRRTRRENAFGPTPCRSLWYCLDCRNPFEQMKAL